MLSPVATPAISCRAAAPANDSYTGTSIIYIICRYSVTVVLISPSTHSVPAKLTLSVWGSVWGGWRGVHAGLRSIELKTLNTVWAFL